MAKLLSQGFINCYPAIVSGSGKEIAFGVCAQAPAEEAVLVLQPFQVFHKRQRIALSRSHGADK